MIGDGLARLPYRPLLNRRPPVSVSESCFTIREGVKDEGYCMIPVSEVERKYSSLLKDFIKILVNDHYVMLLTYRA